MEYFLHRVSETEAAHIPFPPDLPLSEREAYMTKPPAEAIAKAERWPYQHAPKVITVNLEKNDGNR